MGDTMGGTGVSGSIMERVSHGLSEGQANGERTMIIFCIRMNASSRPRGVMASSIAAPPPSVMLVWSILVTAVVDAGEFPPL